MAVEDRPKVKLECLRLPATLRLDPARSKLIGGFIDSYLVLTAVEMRQFERELAKLTPQDKETTMDLVSSWERRGIEIGMQQGLQKGVQQGMHAGKADIVVRILRKRFGTITPDMIPRLNRLSDDHLTELGEAQVDFAALSDLESWISLHPSA